MTHPELRGRKLGAAVTAAAMNHGVEAGLKFMCLATDDFRIPAISIYLKFGWRPFLYAEDMAERWKKVCADLNLAPSSLEDYSLDEENNIIVNHTLA